VVSILIASLSSVLAPVAFLACPIGMGLMMWFMARAAKKDDGKAAGPVNPPSLELLREEQQRLNAQIERLEHEDTQSSRGRD
jgi:hypothetical protein